MYLLAIKSVYRFFGEGKVVAILDRDAPRATHDLLKKHIPGIEIAYVEDIDVGSCQKGGTWERILFILDRSKSEYVIQVDADVLAVTPIDEVVSAYRNSRSFTMAQKGATLEGMLDAAAFSSTRGDHVTHSSQAAFARYPDADHLKYVRGSSGFAGFAKGGFSRAQAEAFSAHVQKLIGAKWREWGSEQVMSNFAVANSPDPIALPVQSYACFDPIHDQKVEDVKCFHFIGTIRFARGYYASLGKRVIDELMSPAA